MADDILEVFIKIANPDVFEKLESLKNKNYTVNINGNIDKGLQDILALRGRNIDITANPANAIAALKGLEASFKSVQNLANIKIKIDPKDADGTIKALQDKIAQLTLATNKISTAGVSGAQAQSIVNNPNFEKALLQAPQNAQAAGRSQLKVEDLEQAYKQIDQANQRVIDLKAKNLIAQIKEQDPFQKRSQQINLADASAKIRKAIDEAFQQQVQIAERQFIEGLKDEFKLQVRKNTLPASFQPSEAEVINDSVTRQRLKKRQQQDAFEAAEIARQAEIQRFRDIQAQGPFSLITDRENAIQQFRQAIKGLPEGPFSSIGFGKAQEEARQREIERVRALNPGPFSSIAEHQELERRRQQEIDRFRSFSQGPFSSIAEHQEQERRRQQEIERFRNIGQAPFSSIAARDAEIERFRAIQQAAPQGKFSPINQRQLQAQAFKDLGQATALGALQGQGVLSLGGSLLGGLAGAAGGTGGVFLGSAIGGAIGQQASQALEKFIHGLERAAEAGIQFESSLLGISSVLQANTTVRGADGRVLPIEEQLQFQGQQARQIQQSARSRLLPLGIAGEKEATLVQAIIAGSSQRGIQLTADQAAVIAERLGGAIQAQRPELLQNTSQVRRDVEDLLSGLPNRTVLGSLVKGFAPGIGQATSAEDLIKRTQGLASFPDALKNSNNPVVALNQFNAAIDNLNVAIGDKLVTTITPALKDLSKTISDPKFTEAINTLSGQIGTLVAGIIKAGAEISQKAGKAIQVAGPQATGTAAGAGGGAALGGLIGGITLGPLGALGGGITGGALGAIFGQNNAVFAQLEETNRTNRELEEELKRRREGRRGESSAASRIGALLRETGTEDFNPDIQRDILTNLQFQAAARDLIPSALQEKLDADKANFGKTVGELDDPQKIIEVTKGFFKQQETDRAASKGQELAANIAISGNLEKLIGERQGLLDASSPLGQINQLQVAQPIQEALVGQAKERLSLAREEADRKIANIAPDASLDVRREETIKAEAEVRAATDNLTKAFLNLINTTEQLQEAENQRAKTLRDSQFDPGTIQGRIGLAQSGAQFQRDQVQDLDTEIGSLRRQLRDAVSPEDEANLKSKLEGAQVKRNQSEVARAGFERAQQTETINLAESFFKVSEAVKSYTLAQEAAKDKLGELTDRTSRLAIQQEQLQLTAKGLDDSLITAKRNIEDFAQDKGLRQLQATNTTQSAAQNVFDTAIQSGFDAEQALGFLGGNVNSAFIKGSPDFDPEAAGLNRIREAQERLRVAQRSESRLSEDDQIEFNKLQREFQGVALQRGGIFLDENDLGRSRRALEREKELLPFEEKNRQFGTLKNLIGLQQQGVETPGGNDLIQTLGKDLGVDTTKIKEAQTQEIETPKNVADIAQTTKDILNVLLGKQDKVKEAVSGSPVDSKSKVQEAMDGTKYTSPDMDFIEKLEPQGILENVGLSGLKPVEVGNLEKRSFDESKRGGAFTGIDVFGGQLLPERKNKTNKERLEDKVDSILSREQEAAKAFAGSVYEGAGNEVTAKRPSLPSSVLNKLSNMSSPTAQAGSGGQNDRKIEAPDVVRAIEELANKFEASMRKALESSI